MPGRNIRLYSRIALSGALMNSGSKNGKVMLYPVA